MPRSTDQDISGTPDEEQVSEAPRGIMEGHLTEAGCQNAGRSARIRHGHAIIVVLDKLCQLMLIIRTSSLADHSSLPLSSNL